AICATVLQFFFGVPTRVAGVWRVNQGVAPVIHCSCAWISQALFTPSKTFTFSPFRLAGAGELRNFAPVFMET
ncbi:MAG: hypothetical protein KBS75_08195, partial [Bacteroidales bacterium]|nr:hypothetical protein [Candidatus Equimonas faecalis]